MKQINKQELKLLLIDSIQAELNVAIQSAKTAHFDATNEESKSENQYDTRAHEASYVARGQAQRVEELTEALIEIKGIPLKLFEENSPISTTALIEVESQGKKSILFFMPKGGGFFVSLEGQKIQVVTPSTPLGEALLGLKRGDSAVVELGKTEREYEIIEVK